MVRIRVGPRSAGCLVLLTVVCLAVTVPATAAGPTTLTVTPTEKTGSVGDSLTFDIVVDNASGGVGAWEATLNLTTGDVADITNVTLHGNPDLRTVSIGENNDSVYFDAALADTNDTGPVAIATVSIKLTAEGQTALDLQMDALGDEEGESYTVAETTDARVATGEITDTATPTPSATPTPTENDSAQMAGEGTDDSTQTDGDATATATDDGTATQTRTATADGTPSTDQPATTAPTSEGSAATTEETPNQQSAPGFTGITALLAVCLSVALVLWRRR